MAGDLGADFAPRLLIFLLPDSSKGGFELSSVFLSRPLF
jgi:hypothetical protein